MTAAGPLRDRLHLLLIDWRDGTRKPAEVINETRELWLAGEAPDDDEIASLVLMMLATGQQGLTHDDIPSLLDLLAAPESDKTSALNQFGDYVLAVDTDARNRLVPDDYYGAARANEEDLEFYIASPDDRRLHRLVREEPEASWDELRSLLCAPWAAQEREQFVTDLLEDLVYEHAADFIDRLEQVVRDCPLARERVAMSYIGGIASSPALDRFWQLQERLRE